MKSQILWVCAVFISSCCCQDDKIGLAEFSVGRFTTSMLAEMGRELGNDNIVFNPVTVWSVLAMVFPAATGITKNEIAAIMNIESPNADQVDEVYGSMQNILTSSSSQVESKIVNLVMREQNVALHDDFMRRLRNVFHAEQYAVDLSRADEAARVVNQWASQATNGRITEAVKSEEFVNLSILLGSAAYFKGKWKYPFARNATSDDKFKNDDDAIISPAIAMMRNRGTYNYTYLPKLESQVIDIPYSDDMSLLVILPRRKVRLQTVLNNMKNMSLSELVPNESMTPEEVDLSLPKFSTSFTGVLNRPLYNLGVQTLLNPDAKLPKISDKAYVTKVTHKAEIETNEEGTEASAVTIAQVVYKTTPISFQANRPFLYFVNHTPTRLILFAGKYSDPRNS